MKTSSTLIRDWDTVTYRSHYLVRPEEQPVHHRQDKLPGFNTAILYGTTILLVGAGGLGGQIGHSLARKGCGRMIICDGDKVETSNLARQHFYPADLHENKALRLARNLARESFVGMRVTGNETPFNADTAAALSKNADLVIVAVDDSETRIFASQYFGGRVPVFFTAVDEAATFCWCFLQKMKSPCLGCLFPNQINLKRERCTEDPASLDILKVASSLVSRAVESVVMPGRNLSWTYYDFDLRTAAGNVSDRPKPRPGCPVCGAMETSR
jgi:molybdopterin/thiamine biosynthesis adenylyltransferase